MAKKRVVVHPHAPTKIKTAAEKNVTDSISEALGDVLDDVTDVVIEHFERKSLADSIIDQLRFEAFESIPKDIDNSLEAVFGEAAESAIDGVYIHVDDDVKRDDVFDLANEDAKEYARARSAEMVGKKWVDGKLVDNPNAEWVITDTTRDGIKSIIERAYESGLTPQEVRKELQTSYGFSKSRAQMIAKTEMNRASSQGTLSGWKQTGLVEGKEWIMGDDHDYEDECNDNDDAGVISVDDDFPSGDDAPPAHPNCNCSMAATLTEE